MSDYQLCECGSRTEPHWKFDDFEHWMVFLISRGISSQAIFHKLTRPGTDEADQMRWETLHLWMKCLYSIWHVGGLQDDGDYIRRMMGEFELRTWTDFDESWRRVRALLDTHHDHERALTHKKLERVRHLECAKGQWQVKLPKKPDAKKQRKKGRRRR